MLLNLSNRFSDPRAVSDVNNICQVLSETTSSCAQMRFDQNDPDSIKSCVTALIHIFDWVNAATLHCFPSDKKNLPVHTTVVLTALADLISTLRAKHLFPRADGLIEMPNFSTYSRTMDEFFRHLSRIWNTFDVISEHQNRTDGYVVTCNSIARIIGQALLGNLILFQTQTLSTLTSQLVTVFSHSSVTISDYHEVLTTLSHLVYTRSIWNKQDGSSSCVQKEDFLSDSNLFETVYKTFMAGLERSDPRCFSPQASDNASYNSRSAIIACLNGLSQLIIRKSRKLDPSMVSSTVRTLWPYALVLSRHGAHTRQPTYLDPSSSGSQSSSASCVSSMENLHMGDASPVKHLSPKLFSNNLGSTVVSSSEDEWLSSNSDVDAVSESTEVIANKLLTIAEPSVSSPGGRNRLCGYRRHHHRNKRSDLSGLKRNWKSEAGKQPRLYALCVFCMEQLLNSGRAKIALDVWPTLMGCDWTISATTREDGDRQSNNQFSDCRPSPADLLTLIYRTGDVQVRQMLIEILNSLLGGVGKRFAIAEDLTPHSTSFVPYSVQLAVELRNLHRRLLLALSCESSVGLEALLLKALTSLVRITPYQRLQSGLLGSLMPALQRLLSLTDSESNRVIDLRAGCLTLLNNVVGKVPGPLLEVCQLLSLPIQTDLTPNSLSRPSIPYGSNNPAEKSRTGNGRSGYLSPTSDDPFSPCWLVQVCLRLIHPNVATFAWDTKLDESQTVPPNEAPPVQVRIQALTVLRDMIPNYGRFLRPSLPLIRKTLLLCLQDTENTRILWTPCLQFLDGLLTQLLSRPFPPGASESEFLTVLSSWWQDFLPSVMRILRESKELSDQLWCCKLGYSLDKRILPALNSTKSGEVPIITELWKVLQGVYEQSAPTVQARLVRVMSHLISLKCPLMEASTIVPVIKRIECLCYENDKDAAISFDLACSFVACLELLVINRQVNSSAHNFHEAWPQISCDLQISGLSWIKLVALCCQLTSPRNLKQLPDSHPQTLVHQHVKSLRDPEHVKHPGAHRCEMGARATGYLLRLLSPEMKLSQEQINLLMQTMVEAMNVDNVCSSEKIRWRANYAIGHLFCNQDLWSTDLILQQDALYSKKTLKLICDVIEQLSRTFAHDRYFKARLYAANSLLLFFTRHPQAAHWCNVALLGPKPSLEEFVEIHVVRAAISLLDQADSKTQPIPLVTLGPQSHLTEVQYRFHCVSFAASLLFYSLASLLIQLGSLQSPELFTPLDRVLQSELNDQKKQNLIILIHNNDDNHNPGTELSIFPKCSPPLDIADSKTPAERLQEACSVFRSTLAQRDLSNMMGLSSLYTISGDGDALLNRFGPDYHSERNTLSFRQIYD